MRKIIVFLTFAAFLVSPSGNMLHAQKAKNKAEWVVRQLHDPASKHVLVLAHRGDWRNHPENSLEGIESAIQMGADIIEIDLRRTKDGELVNCHDETLNRTTNGNGKVSDYTLAEIKQLKLRKGNSIVSDGIRMPTFRECLEVCKDRAVVLLDKAFEYYDQVLEITEEMGVTGQVIMKSYSKKQADAKFAGKPGKLMFIPCLALPNENSRKDLETYMDTDPQIAYEVSWDEAHQQLAEEMCRKVVANGSKVFVNTLWADLSGGYDDEMAVTDADKAYGKLVDMGATIIQCDSPERLIRWLHKHRRHKALYAGSKRK